MISDLAGLLDHVPLAAVPAVLVLLFFICCELGFRLHRYFASSGSADDETQVLSTALLVLALLLGFTFSMALGRYDERRKLVVQEANDIGTAWLRAGLVPAPHGPALQQALADYVRLRQSSPLPSETEKLAAADRQRDRVWALTAATQALLDPPRAVSLVSAVNNVLDTGTMREKSVAARVPGEVIVLLVVFAGAACFLLGYVLAAHGQRHRLVSGMLFALMALTVMLILDLDRPADGAILVDQSALRELALQLANAAPAAQK